ncbi:hypothetical protein B0H66DRAFT_298191 [Apodospora peruviana]|uniref:Uncharacterized protein n=1 Tax=Apodospora peruviana TaxID=516989 RepID=A0AAE0I154_9PEZI|nr:hypothetical protein B0H66DRAFT_298191 [Apodospora peruviana]
MVSLRASGPTACRPLFAELTVRRATWSLFLVSFDAVPFDQARPRGLGTGSRRNSHGKPSCPPPSMPPSWRAALMTCRASLASAMPMSSNSVADVATTRTTSATTAVVVVAVVAAAHSRKMAETPTDRSAAARLFQFPGGLLERTRLAVSRCSKYYHRPSTARHYRSRLRRQSSQ